jgi:outer membrane protein
MQNSKDTPQFRISNTSNAHHILPGLSFLMVCVLCFPLLSSAQDSMQSRPLSLEDCIEIALASSPDVTAAHERIEQARAAVQQAMSGFYPRLSLNETFTRSDFGPLVFSNQLAQGNLSGDFPTPPPPGFDPFAQFNDPGPLNNWNTKIALQWPLFQGGQTYYGRRAAVEQVVAAERALETLHNNLAFSVAAAYWGILKTENSIEIAQQSVRQIHTHLDVASARFENDVALRSDVLRVSVRLAEAEEALEIALHNLERAKAHLNLAMGNPINNSIRLAHYDLAPVTPAETIETLEELTEEARKSRSEIKGIDCNLAALEDSVRAARADHFPKINAFANYDIDSEDFSESHDSWTIGIGASLPIFDGFLVKSNIRAARAKLREAEAQKLGLTLLIDMDVKNAYLAKSEAARRLEVLQETVSQSEETLRIVTERYAEGLALVTELLDSEVALTNARLRLLSAEYDHLVAAASLERAVGRIMGEGPEK